MSNELMKEMGVLTELAYKFVLENKELTKRKLTNYKRLRRAFSESELQEAADCINTQLQLLGGLQEGIIRLNLLKKRSQTESEQPIIKSYLDSVALLNELLVTLRDQRECLADPTNSPIDKMNLYRALVKEELDIYHRSQKIAAALPPEVFSEAAEHFLEVDLFKCTGVHVLMFVMVLIILNSTGLLKEETPMSTFDAFMVLIRPIMVGGFVSFGLISSYEIIKNMRKVSREIANALGKRDFP